MKVVGVIEARMGSSRFPGKVLQKLAGRPILWHVAHRMRRASSLSHIVLATSLEPRDDRLVEYADRIEIDVVRGSEDNLLDRHLKVANKYLPDIIVRVTGDCPLVDPSLIDALVSHLVASGAGFCTAEKGVPCIHEGIDPFTVSALKRLAQEAGEDPVAKEHVSAYFKHHEDFVPIAYLPIEADYQIEGTRVSIDTPADLRFLESVYAHLAVEPGDIDMRDVVRLLRQKPEMLSINTHVHQKSVSQQTRRVLIRCDGDQRLGLGHVVRCLALADEFRETFGFGVTFAVARSETAASLIGAQHYPVEKIVPEQEAETLDRVITTLRPDILVLDIRTDLSPSAIIEWKRKGVFTVVIDDPSDRRLCADQAFYPMVPQVEKMDWSGFAGNRYCGWEWTLIRKAFANRSNRPLDRQLMKILVTMGGSDPFGLTLKSVSSLERIKEDFETMVVIGAAFMHEKALNQIVHNGTRKYRIVSNTDRIEELMADSDLAIASFGTTAYELASQGTPSILLCISEDHAVSASALEAAGAAMSLGYHEAVSTETLADATRHLISHASTRERMHRAGLAIIDGKGASRCASEIATAVSRHERRIGC